jgi:hypothetical protein
LECQTYRWNYDLGYSLLGWKYIVEKTLLLYGIGGEGYLYAMGMGGLRNDCGEGFRDGNRRLHPHPNKG